MWHCMSDCRIYSQRLAFRLISSVLLVEAVSALL